MSGEKVSRRRFCGDLAKLAAVGALIPPGVTSAAAVAPPDTPSEGNVFVPWSEGGLDLHHIATGRGSAMLAICPDGTTLMVDAGAIYDSLKYIIAPLPDASRRPGEWVARYAARQLRAAGVTGIDHLLVSHLHADHIGQWTPELPTSSQGHYQLTGIMDVAEQIPIRKLVDRDYPDYGYPAATSLAVYPKDKLTFDNYRNYVAHRERLAQTTERFIPGTTRQFPLVRAPEKFPQFHVRNLAANGEVWTGAGEETARLFPAGSSTHAARLPTENMCSTAIRIQHGRFSYYTGGDLPNEVVGWYGDLPWQDIATPVGRAAGPVSVAVANHHGYVDSMGADCVRALQPRVFVIMGWDSAHPTIRPLYNMLSRDLYPGDRDIFATAVKEENLIATRDLAKLTGRRGHVVIRVPPDGASFRVQILDPSDEKDRVLATHGPYPCT